MGRFLMAALVALPAILTAQQKTEVPTDVLAMQVALDRAGFSPGEIDGRDGPKTRLAMSEFLNASKSPPAPAAEPIIAYTITEQDVAGPFIDQLPDDMMERAKLSALTYASPLEALSEKFHSSPAFLQKLNPGVAWKAGDTIQVPNVEPFQLPSKAEKPTGAATTEVIVSSNSKSLVVRDGAGKTLMHAPITLGSDRDPPPIGRWKVVSVSWNPVFNYNPDLFWDADPTHAKAKIPAGPNNPVGVVWIDINKEHFGLHGTPEPSAIGRTESHGCIRLTNWDATRLARLVAAGSRVTIQ